jgi:phage terminase Nu1 subunit (DNA packaging protein)
VEGVDIFDPKQLEERMGRKHTTSGGEMHAARLRKLKAEAITAELKAAEMDGKLIPLVDCEQAFTKIGNVTKSLLQRLRADLPPALEGQTPSRMAELIGQAVEAILTQISDPEGMAWRK